MIADLAVGQWTDWWLDTFCIDDSNVEGYIRMKLIALSPTADMFEVFAPQIWPREGYTYPGELAREIDEKVGSFLQNLCPPILPAAVDTRILLVKPILESDRLP